MPTGWAVYRGVRIVSRLQTDSSALDPLVTSQSGSLGVVGGLRMPGLIRRWSTEASITIAATVSDGASLSVSLNCQESLNEKMPDLVTLPPAQGQLIHTITSLSRTPGSYRLEARSPADSKDVRQSHTFQRVCRRSPSPGTGEPWRDGGSDRPRGVPRKRRLCAAGLEAGIRREAGADSPPTSVVDGAERLRAHGQSSRTGRHGLRRRRRRCARWDLDTNHGNKWDRAECAGCGMVRMYQY